MIRKGSTSHIVRIPQTGETEYAISVVNNVEWQAIEAANAALSRAFVESGGTRVDPDLARKSRINTNENLARHIKSIRNAYEIDDCLDTPRGIADFLNEMPPGAWNTLTDLLLGQLELTVFEKKVSSSQSESSPS